MEYWTGIIVGSTAKGEAKSKVRGIVTDRSDHIVVPTNPEPAWTR